MSSLSEQVVLITGASVGIGAALARLLAERFMGIRLVLAARSAEKLEAVATLCRKAGAEVLVVPTDLEQIEQIEALAKTAIAHFGRVDALVNNAGYGQSCPTPVSNQLTRTTCFDSSLSTDDARSRWGQNY